MFSSFRFFTINSIKLCYKKQLLSTFNYSRYVHYCKLKQYVPVVKTTYGSNNFVANLSVSGILTFLGLQEKTEEDKESELITTLKRSILLIQKEEFKKAEQMLHLALKLAQEQQNSDGITYCYDIMANLAYDLGDYPKAQKLFKSVMQRLMANGIEADDNKILHISVKLAKMYEAQNEKGIAEEGYKFCIENLEGKVKNGDHSEDTMLLWAMSLDFYAHFLLTQNRLKEALGCFKKAYETCVEVNGSDNEQVVVLLNDLGTVTNLLGDAEQAVTYFESAVSIGRKLPDMKDLGSVLVNLGHSYLLRRMLSESEKACEDGRRVAMKYEDKGTADEAEVCLEEVRKAMRG